jgi:hypothetical protein
MHGRFSGKRSAAHVVQGALGQKLENPIKRTYPHRLKWETVLSTVSETRLRGLTDFLPMAPSNWKPPWHIHAARWLLGGTVMRSIQQLAERQYAPTKRPI